ncbi:BTB/POZ domain-containing protein 2 [Orchesella cincta]|uniref:BTB/POZ domain-containing protein 2 n=1 Tax=Orchesella cincta TaxID=48709 RepID=A0A1D2MT89_ORCCI|nr:BTB/POZ domain-containing protein 2 [Orchesella cincta]
MERGKSSSSGHNIKREPRGPPSPTPSLAPTVAITPSRPPISALLSPTASTSAEKGSISVKSLASLMDPDDQLSMVSNAESTSTSERARGSQVTAIMQDEVARDWRVQTKCVRERLQYILEHDKTYQDVVFEVHGKASKQRFSAHKLILRIASIGFDTLFKEADSIPTCSRAVEEGTVIIVNNIEPEIFKLLLKFIYTDEIEMSNLKSEEILQLLQAARMYEVSTLYVQCVQTLKNEISDDVAIQLCEMGASYDDSLLLETALNHIASKAFDIFPSESFLNLSCESICRLIGRDDLRIDETSLFQAIIHWANSKCTHSGIENTSVNLREVLQEIIPKIRFPLMSAQEFTFRVVPTQILTPEEQVQIYQYVSVEPSERGKLPPISFSTTPRRSKKSLDFEREDSLSDYRENSSNDNTPDRVRLPANHDSADITTTEPESETASMVSSSSVSRKRSRKYERSLSSVSSKKRMKEEKIQRKPSTSAQLNDLFGEPHDHIINIENKTVSLNSLILDWSRSDRRGVIEVIKMTNVKVEDFKKLEGFKVRFPNLKEFNLNVIIDESINSVICDFSFDKLLFFHTPKKVWSYEDLWSMNINITLIINRLIVLKISPNVNHVILNKFNGASVVLKSLKEQPVKSIVYSHTHFPSFFHCTHFASLRRLVLLSFNSHTRSEFFQNFKHLKDLTLVPLPHKEVKVLEFNEKFLSKDKLRKLGLGDLKLEIGSTVKFRSMEGLYLWKTTWNLHFEEKVHQIFPNLKEISLIGPMKGSAKLLKNILRIQTLSEVFSWACDWRLSANSPEAAEMRKFLTNCDLNDSEQKSFVLKRDEVGPWKGKKIQFTTSQNQIYSKLNYDFIFEDFACFHK